MKNLLIAISFIAVFQVSEAQSLINKTASTFTTPYPTFVLSTPVLTRHNNFYYTDYKVSNHQVISLHQPSTPFDVIFYVDKSGTTQYKSMGPTGSLNTKFNYKHQYDSFNPYGSKGMKDVLLAGVLNSIFKNGIRKIGIK